MCTQVLRSSYMYDEDEDDDHSDGIYARTHTHTYIDIHTGVEKLVYV